MDGETFTEFTDSASLDSNAGTMSLNVIFDDYMYSTAYYQTSDVQYAIDSPILTKVTAADGSTSWTMQAHVTTGEEGSSQTVTIESGADIYVLYIKKAAGYTPPAPSPAEVKGPITEKSVTDNHDGTYTVRLDITGQQDHSVNRIGANVIVILDRTQSMSNAMGNTTRMAAARTALQTLINTLNPDQNLINFTVVGFANRANYYNELSWTQTKSTMLTYAQTANYVSGNGGLGTPWQSGLYGGIVRANEAATDTNLNKNKTYVIFVTDGNPNAWYTRSNADGGPTNNPDFHQQGSGSFVQSAYDAAIPNAVNLSNMVGNRFYGIYCGGANDDGKGHLQDLMSETNAGSSVNGTFIDGTSADAINSAFENIAQTIVSDLGSSEVVADDGIPTLGNVSAAVSGPAGGFRYYIKPQNGTETEWEDAPSAGYSSSNGVTWDLAAAGVLADGTTYSLEFDVWPTQAAYDLLADLNNGVKTLPLKKADGTVDDDQMAQLVIKIGSDRYVYTPGETVGSGTWTGGLTTAQLVAAITAAENAGTVVTYSIPTNTHLNTTYSYNGTTYRDTPAGELPSEDMLLKDTTIKIKKLWQNYLDSRNDEDIDGLQMVLSKDGEEYLEFDVSSDTGWEADNIFISCGVIASGVIKETGHDYYVSEKPAEESDKTPYWEVDSPVYHPMVINGTTTMLIEVDTAAESDYTINGKYYKVDNESGTMSAVNERVSWLNLIKKQTDGINPDDFFEFTVNIAEADGDDIYFSVFGGGVSYRDDITVSENVTTYQETVNGEVRNYYVAPSGADFTLEVKPSWSVRFLNLTSGTTYTIKETGMNACYEFASAQAVETLYSAYKVVADGYPKTTDFTANNITGTINQTNTDYTVNVTNKPLYFFVYHSSDNKIEKISMDDSRISNSKFNIVEETKEGYLYGGYFKAYTKAGMTDAQIVAATYTNGSSGSYTYAASHPTTGNWTTDSSGTAYTGSAVSFKKANAYTENGMNMIPVAGTVYYLKEVPNQYFRPATYVVWDTRAENLDLKQLYMLSVTDDSLYQKTGLDGTINLDPVTRLYTSFKVTNDTGSSVTIKPANVNSKLSRGYLTVWDANSKIAAGTYTITPFFVTLDGVKVTSAVTRTVTVGSKLSKSDFTTSDKTVVSGYSTYTDAE